MKSVFLAIAALMALASANHGIGPSGSAWSCVTSLMPHGACGPYSDYPEMGGSTSDPVLDQNVWSSSAGYSQTLSANSPDDWQITANGVNNDGGAVVSYPNVGAGYNEQPLSSFDRITSSFSETMPHNSSTSAWAAFDLWFNNWNDEVMIQHDFSQNSPCDYAAVHAFGGSGGVPRQLWGLCLFGSERVWKLAARGSRAGSTGTVDESSGTVDILQMMTWMEDHGYLPANSTITDFSYGWEICYTGGVDENFTNSGFSINAVPGGSLKVPNVIGMTEGQAYGVLSASGLRPRGPAPVRGVRHIVMAQHPAAGSFAYRGTVIGLISGVRVPRLVGMAQARALEVLSAMGLRGAGQPGVPGKVRIVTAESPAAGRLDRLGSTVDLTTRVAG